MVKKKEITTGSVSPELFTQGLGIKALARAIFKGDLPDYVIRTLPAQTVYLSILANGLDSSRELIEMLTIEQYRSILDLEFWTNDRFDEERFWEWLLVANDAGSLKPLERLLLAMDRELLALVISHQVETVSFEEPSEAAPGPGFYTPDRGYTWVSIRVDDADRHRAMGRLLALQFQHSADIFYQLLATSRFLTTTELEENCYSEKVRRLLDQGIPDRDTAWNIHRPLHPATAKQRLVEITPPAAVSYQFRVTPFINEHRGIQPLQTLLAELDERNEEQLRDAFERELSLIANAALVRNKIVLNEYSDVYLAIMQVRGAINMGLEQARLLAECSAWRSYEALGLQGLFQLGFYHLHELHCNAQRIERNLGEQEVDDPLMRELLKGALALFPYAPRFALAERGVEENLLKEQSTLPIPFSHLTEVQAVNKLLCERFGN